MGTARTLRRNLPPACRCCGLRQPAGAEYVGPNGPWLFLVRDRLARCRRQGEAKVRLAKVSSAVSVQGSSRRRQSLKASGSGYGLNEKIACRLNEKSGIRVKRKGRRVGRTRARQFRVNNNDRRGAHPSAAKGKIQNSESSSTNVALEAEHSPLVGGGP